MSALNKRKRARDHNEKQQREKERVMGRRRGWEHEEQESKSVRGQQVPAPCFYKLQLIGHLVFSTQCNTQPPNEAPATPLPLSHVVLSWAAVTRQTRSDLGQPPPPGYNFFLINPVLIISPPTNPPKSSSIK